MTTEHLTGDEAAALLGVSRRTLYRWAERGRITRAWWQRDTLAPYVVIDKLPKGPPRRRSSLRYTVYRHSFTEVRRHVPRQ